MTTAWTFPTIFSQYAEEGAELAHITWNDLGNFNSLRNADGKFLETTQPLLHIACSPKLDIRMKTYYIKVTGFNFQNLPETVSGIEARLTSNRKGRIVVETIQLCMGDQLVGNNHATLPIMPVKVYGSDIDLWGIESLTIADLQDLTFGIVVRLQSHPDWPHKEPAFIDAIELRIH
jgi:hypothetical protein